MTTGQLVPIKVTVDGADDVLPEFDVMHVEGDDWNGFVVPHLTREQVDALFSDARAWGAEIDWHYDADDVLCLIDNPEMDNESVTRIRPITGLYRLDIGWTFMPVESASPACTHEDGTFFVIGDARYCDSCGANMEG